MEIRFVKSITPKPEREFKAKPLDVNLQKMQTKLKQRCESEMNDEDNFTPITEKYTIHRNYQPELPADEVKLECRKSDNNPDGKQRVLELSVTNIDRTVETRCIVAEGAKEKILEILDDISLFLDIKNDVWAICQERNECYCPPHKI